MEKVQPNTFSRNDKFLHLSKNEIPIKPFLKWAGGKTQLLNDIRKFIPLEYNKYIEPFIGAGALFFSLHPNKSVISDSNSELILTYEEVRDNPDEIINLLNDFLNEKDFYYKVRSWDLETKTRIQRAARFIYLNKTCFNGLYRVNKKGLFNVPFGHRKNPRICDKEQILSASLKLQNTNILSEDFESVLTKYAEPNDLVFLDPPYYPVSEYSDFKRYTKEFFYESDQVRLKENFDKLVEIGATPILTNSDAPFILDLYSDYNIHIIETRRSISSNPNTRKGKDIIVIPY